MTEGERTRPGGAAQAPTAIEPGMRDIAAPFGPANPGDSLQIMGEAI